MPIEIELPGGEIAEFPDDMSDDDIEAALRNELSDVKIGPTPEFRGEDVRRTHDYGLTTRGGPPLSIPEGASAFGDMASAGAEALGSTLGMFRRPEGQPVGAGPLNPSEISGVVRQNLELPGGPPRANIPEGVLMSPDDVAATWGDRDPRTLRSITEAPVRFERGAARKAGEAAKGFARTADIVGRGELLAPATVPRFSAFGMAARGGRPAGRFTPSEEARTKKLAQAAIDRQKRLEEESGTYQWGADQVNFANKVFAGSPDIDDTFISELAQAAGGTLPDVALGFIPAVGPALASASYGLQAGEQQAQEAIAAGKPEAADVAFVSAAGLGAGSEMLIGGAPRFWAAVKAARAAKVTPAKFAGALSNWISKNPAKAQFAKFGAREAGQEGLEQVGGNVIASDIAGYDPNRPMLQGVPKAMAMGGALGSMMGGAVNFASMSDAAAAEEAQSAAPQPLNEEESSRYEDLVNKIDSEDGLSETELDELEAMDTRRKATPTPSPEEAAEADAALNRYIDEEGIGGKTDVVDSESLPGDSPMHFRIAQYNVQNGRIEINKSNLERALQNLPAGRREKFARSLLNEENTHSHTTPEEAQFFGGMVSAIERKIGTRIYTGRWSGEHAGIRLDDKMLGYEIIRRRVQRLNRMTPTEIAKAVGRERWTLESLDFLDNLINKSRQLFKAEGTGLQKAIFDNVAKKLKVAKDAAAGIQGEDAPAQPMTRAAEKRIAKLRDQRLAEIRKSEVQETPIEDVSARIIELSNKSKEKPLTEGEMEEMRDLRRERDRREAGEFPAAPAEGTKPQIAKLNEGGGLIGAHKNPFGDPSGTTYHATPEDWAKWQSMPKATFDNFADREALKNKYGGMPPEPPLEESPAALGRDPNAPDFGDYNSVFDDAVAKIAGAKTHQSANKILEELQKTLGAKVDANMRKLYGPSKGYANNEKLYKEARALTRIIRGLGDEYWAHWGEKFLADRDDQQSFPAAGISKKEARRLEELRKYQEAMGKRPVTERTMDRGEVVEPSERVGATESGALPRLTATDMDIKADMVLAEPITPRKATSALITEKKYQLWRKAQEKLMPKKDFAQYLEMGEEAQDLQMRSAYSEARSLRARFDRPNFREFESWAKSNVEGVQPHQLRDMWEDSVWSHLVNATPERLAQWREALGLEIKYGKGTIAPRIEPEAKQLATEGNKIVAKQNRAQTEAAERYRNKIVSAIAQKLIGESVKERAELNRTDITIDDVDFSNKKSKQGPYVEISPDDLTSVQDKATGQTRYGKLNAILRDQARASNADPESASRRLVAVVNRKTGDVELLSTYNDAGVQRVTDPAGARLTGKPTRELNKAFLNQFRPFASVLLRDPVKGFRKRFESVADFNDQIGQEAKERTSVGDFLQEGSSEFSAEGTPGLQGEGGTFQGPHRTTFRRGAMESPSRLTRPEAEGVLEHIWNEVGDFDSPNDVKLALIGLLDKSSRGRMRAKDYLAQSAYRKMVNALQREFPDMGKEDILNRLADRIYENNVSSQTLEEFQAKTVAQFKGTDTGYAGEQEAAPQTGRPRVTPGPPGQLPYEYGAPTGAVTPRAELGSDQPVYPGVIPVVSDAQQQIQRDAANRAGKEYQANQDWAAAFGEVELQGRINKSKIMNLRARVRRQQGLNITPAEARAILESKKGARPPLDPRTSALMRRSERSIDDPLRTESPAALADWFKKPARSAREAINPDVDNPVPRFIDNVDTQLTRAQGIERIPLVGRLWGNRAKIQDASDQAIVGYGVKRSIGNSQSAIIGARLNDVVDRLANPFEQMTDGKMMNVASARRGQSMYPSDLFEDWQRQVVVPEKMRDSGRFSDSEIAEYESKHPHTFELSRAQQQQFREYLNIIEDGNKYLDEKNAKLETYGGESKETRARQQVMFGLPKGLEVYPMPRIALYKRELGPVKAEIQKRVGGSYQVERDRLYKTEAEGQRTTVYEPDMNKRIVSFIQRVYKAVADADLANNPVLKGESPEIRAQRLAKQYEMEMRLQPGEEGRISQKDILDMAYQPRLGLEGKVEGHPGFEGKIYPIEIANKLNKAFSDRTQRYVRIGAELSTASKAFMLTGDLAQYLQQGSLLMLDSPRVWGRAMARSLKAIAKPNVTGRLLNTGDNMQAATEFVQGGGSMGHLQDFMSGSAPGELASRIPAFRQVVLRSGRAFGVFQDMAKLEMWKAVRDTTPREQWPEAIEQIENLGLSGKMEAAGMSHARAIGERLLLMAPAYYRGAMNIVANAFEGGVSANRTRMALAKYAGGLTLMMVSAYLAAGMDWEEIRHRLTPGQGNDKFLKYPVKIGNDTLEIGPGGIVLSLLNLGTDVAVTSVDDPKKMVSLGTDNPIIKWLSSRLGPVPSLARKVATGEDVFGRQVGPAQAAGAAIGPIPVQKGIAAAQSANVPAGAVSAAASFIGLDSKKYKAANDVYEMAQEFVNREGLKKESGFDQVSNEEPSYSKLRGAVSAGSQRRFNEIRKVMTENRTDLDLIKGMREWRKSPFTGSKKAEAAFRSELTEYQTKLYEQAQEERDRVFDEFLEMMEKAP